MFVALIHQWWTFKVGVWGLFNKSGTKIVSIADRETARFKNRKTHLFSCPLSLWTLHEGDRNKCILKGPECMRHRTGLALEYCSWSQYLIRWVQCGRTEVILQIKATNATETFKIYLYVGFENGWRKHCRANENKEKKTSIHKSEDSPCLGKDTFHFAVCTQWPSKRKSKILEALEQVGVERIPVSCDIIVCAKTVKAWAWGARGASLQPGWFEWLHLNSFVFDPRSEEHTSELQSR